MPDSAAASEAPLDQEIVQAAPTPDVEPPADDAAYPTDHAEERSALYGRHISDAYMHRVCAKSSIPSGMICAGLAAAGAIGTMDGAHGTVSLLVGGVIGMALNALGFRNDRRRARESDAQAEDALTRVWEEEARFDIVTAPPFSYPEGQTLRGWSALDRIRLLKVETETADPDASEWFFPEVRRQFPPPSDDELDILHALEDGEITSEEADRRLEALPGETSGEAMVRALGEAPEAINEMWAALGESLQAIIVEAPGNSLPVIANQLDERIEERLDAFAARLGKDATAGCIFDVMLPREDGGTFVVRYDFLGDGSFGSTFFRLEDLRTQQLSRQFEALGVPEAPGLEYADPADIWNAIDGLRHASPAADAAVRQTFPGEAAIRAAVGTPEGVAAGMQVLGFAAVQALSAATTPEDLTTALHTVFGILNNGATPGTTYDFTVMSSIVRGTFDPAGATLVEYAPDGPAQEVAEPAADAAPAPATPSAPAAPETEIGDL